jgi:polyadenylate-binding protein
MATKTISPQQQPAQVPARSVTQPQGESVLFSSGPGGAQGAPGADIRSASASLYVGDLAQDVTESLLFDIFNAVGPVATVRVCRDAATRRSLGYAYVNFHRVEDAERALDTMNFKAIRNKACRIMWSHRDPSLRKSGVGNIFVKNLHPDFDNKNLYDTFSLYGNILSCKVAQDKQGRSLGYGFVHYETEQAAKDAIARSNGKVLGTSDGNLMKGYKTIVIPFKSKSERGLNNARFTNVYLKNIPVEVTQEQLEEKAGAFGTITSTFFPRDPEGKFRGFAFLNYEDADSAAEAVERLNGMQWGEKPLYVCRGQKKEEREKELRSRFEAKKVERQKKWEGVNLYVKYLADEITDDRLLAEFQRFGTIESAKVMFDSNKKSKGFGFVCFSSPEEATKAVTEMNGRMLEGKPLYVSLAQRKDVRKAHLEAQYHHRTKLGGLPTPHMFPQGPMLYQGMPQRMMNMYPPTMPLGGAPRGRFPNQGGPMLSMRSGQPIATHQLMPVGQPRQPQGGPGQQRRRGPGGRQGAQQGGAGRQQGQPGQPAYKYNNNVRNQQPVGETAAAPSAGGRPAAPAETSTNSRVAQETMAALAAAPSEDAKKNILGERLFPMIEQSQGKRAGKITGMLLEMDNNELILLLESRQALQEKIEEALEVLQTHEE